MSAKDFIQDMERQKFQIIAGAKHDIGHLEDLIKIVSPLDFRNIYEFRDNFHKAQCLCGGESFHDYLVKINSFGTTSISFRILATNGSYKRKDEQIIHFPYTDIGPIKQVFLKDLPLYINWPWISAEFTELLKGTK